MKAKIKEKILDILKQIFYIIGGLLYLAAILVGMIIWSLVIGWLLSLWTGNPL